MKYKRNRIQRLSPLAWLCIGVVALVLLLASCAGLSRMLDEPVLLAEASPTLDWPTGTATLEPVALVALTATATLTASEELTPPASFPAYWTTGMWQDAEGEWWPSEAHRQAVQEMIKQHYLAWYVSTVGPYDEILRTKTVEDARRLQTGEVLEGFHALKRAYEETGEFPTVCQVVTERHLTVQNFSPDGLTAHVGDTMKAGYHLYYNADTGMWDRVEIPEDGKIGGNQYLGVLVYEMLYDPEDGRWKVARSLEWIPRPTPDG
jgi:hypothetical protein